MVTDVDGDIVYVNPLRDETLAIVIGDVSGHGLGPALLTAELRGFLRALTLCTTTLPRILEFTNTFFAGDVEEGQFATLLIAPEILSQKIWGFGTRCF